MTAERAAVMQKPFRLRRQSAGQSPSALLRQNQKDRFLIVGVGASAGGLEAYRDLLAHLPADTGMAFVLVQHLDPTHDSELTGLLAQVSAMPVREVTNNLPVEPNHVYVIPPNRTLRIAQGILKLQARDQGRTPMRSIDSFFESLAEDQRERAIGVILSGTATDGTLGLEAIKADGGITFAQDESAKYDSMPRNAVAAGCVDFVLAPENIANELARIAKHPYAAQPAVPSELERDADQRGGAEVPLASGGHGTLRSGAVQARAEAKAAPGDARDDGYKRILLLLRNHCGVDFSLYKSTTIQRRIARRMVLNKLTSLEEYAQLLKGSTKERDALYSDALISVTSFFRTPEAFDGLKHTVFSKLLQQRGDEPLRVWVLGCSTGQEAYSIAMAFVEAAEHARRTPRLQVFATDLNDALLDKARHGLYAKSLARDISPPRLRRFFVEEEGGYRISKPLREMVVFARQNLLSDPPFSRMDLISCRNLLIYLEPSVQKKVLPVFHYALKPGGFLFLGASESIGSFTNLFAEADKRQKIYTKKTARTVLLQLAGKQERDTQNAPGKILHARTTLHQAMPEGFHAELHAEREADRVMIGQYAPPSVLINADMQILQFRGPTSAYLEPHSGKASFDVLKMARQGLMLPLRVAINKAKKDNKPVRGENVRVEQNGSSRTVNVEVIPLRNLRERWFLVVFEDAEKGARPPSRKPPHGVGRSRAATKREECRWVAELERELSETRDYLHATQEQHEAVQEELQASSEEVQSANEELQSINEELETSKEELESANEELTTVNEEMASRNTELNRLNSDLINFQTSTCLAIVLLGRDLSIRRFSAQAEKQFNLSAADVGRPFGTIRHNLVLPEDGSADLENFIAEVIDTMRARQRDVRDTEGRWYSLRVCPYLTSDRKVDGAVLVLVNIDDLKRSEQAMVAARDYAEAIVHTTPSPLVVLTADLHVQSANEAFYKTFKVSPAESEGRLIYELGNRQWDIPKLRNLLEDVLRCNSSFNDFEVTHDFQDLGPRTMLLNARTLHEISGQRTRILLGIQDVSELLHFQAAAREGAAKFKVLFERSPLPKFVVEPETLRFIDVNEAATEHYGYSREEFLRMSILDVRTPEAARALEAALARPPHRPPDREICQHRKSDGTIIEADVRVNEFTLAGKRAWVASIIDITDRMQAEEALRKAERYKDEFLAMLAHELRNPLAPILNALHMMRVVSDRDKLEWARAVAERQVRQLARLVNDLLDISRISSGRIDLLRAPVELTAIVAAAVEVSGPLIDARKHKLSVVLPEDSVWLEADAARLTQVVVNLLNNAAKYTAEDGRISLSAKREAEQVVLRVQDSGMGIAPDMLPRVFDLFAQADRSLAHAQGGLGVGLALVRKIVELHRGTVEAFSEGVGQGSTFVVRLPLSSAALRSAPPEVENEAAGAGRRVLVVDDNVDGAECVAMLLRPQGHDVRAVHDGWAALEVARSWHPDVVLLDIGLPGMDGYEVARQMRGSPELSSVLLVAVTGYGQDEDRRRGKEAGFDEHLVKPVDPHTLNSMLASLSSHRKAGSGDSPA